ncbi:hypothetical protein JVU11DRAFT_4518 [Chiua virens]|nr:hypothetical protein JVU11DRAFT_4518 [Chiua virens]
MSSSALPLKVTPASTPARPGPISEAASDSRTPTKQSVTANPSEISSPHELTAFVETLLEQLDTKFDEMSSQILDRMLLLPISLQPLDQYSDEVQQVTVCHESWRVLGPGPAIILFSSRFHQLSNTSALITIEF